MSKPKPPDPIGAPGVEAFPSPWLGQSSRVEPEPTGWVPPPQGAAEPAGYPPPGYYGQPAPPVAYGPFPYGAYNQAWAQAQLNAQSKNGLGVAALVCGIAGLVFVPLLASIAAVVLGHLGLKASTQGLANNRSFSVAGLVLGYVGLGLLVLVVIAVMVLLAIGVALEEDPSVISAIWQATPAFL